MEIISCLLLENIKIGYLQIQFLFLKFLKIQTKSSSNVSKWPFFFVLYAENTSCFYLDIGFTGIFFKQLLYCFNKMQLIAIYHCDFAIRFPLKNENDLFVHKL